MPVTPKQSLTSDPARSAAESIRGYVYQALHSVLAWIQLQDGQRLFLEGAEDLDVIEGATATSTQVKDVKAQLSLGTGAAREAIANYWKARTANPGIDFRYRYLTRAAVGIERGEPFGAGKAGIDVWRDGVTDAKAAEQVRAFLLGQPDLDKALLTFLQSATLKDLQEELLARISWDAASDSVDEIEAAVSDLLVEHGQAQATPILPTDCERVSAQMLREVLKIAASGDLQALTRASFCRFFEEQTTVRVPAHQAQLLQQFSTTALAGLTSGVGTLAIATATSSFAVPEIYFNAVPRDALVSQYKQLLLNHGVLAIHGSTGFGKSTLAKQVVAGDVTRRWLWLAAAELDTSALRMLLREVISMSAMGGIRVGVVLDDLTISAPQVTTLGHNLIALLANARRLATPVLVTGTRPLPHSVVSAAGINADSIVSPPPLDDAEIDALAAAHGCPSKAGYWTKVIAFQTLGHPQLVHARVLSLAKEGWPALAVNDLVGTPSDLKQIQQETRTRLVEELSAPQRLLIQRLSLCSGTFRRALVVALAEQPVPIGAPADVFDPLVGPWVETANDQTFRLSTLLRTSANEVMSEGARKDTHRCIAGTILGYKELSFTEASTLLLHAYLGQGTAELTFAAHGFMTAPSKIWTRLAPSLSWFSSLAKVGEPVAKQQPALNAILRLLQFKIATESGNWANAGVVLDAWYADQQAAVNQRVDNMMQLLMLSMAIPKYEIDLPASRVVAMLVDFARLEVETRTPGFELPKLSPKIFQGLSKNVDTVAVLFSFCLMRIRNRAWLSDLVSEIEAMPGDTRERILSVFATSEMQTSMMVDKAWLADAKAVSEAKTKRPDWNGDLQVLERISKVFARWQCANVVDAAVRARSVIMDEYLGRPDEALALLNQRLEVAPLSMVVRDAKAMVLSRSGRDADALAVWDATLDAWMPDAMGGDTRQAYSRRRAALAAARLNKWGDAARHFRAGRTSALSAGQDWMATGFSADSGYAQWRNGEKSNAIESFREALEEAESRFDADEQAASFVFRKLAGHLLVRLTQEEAGVTDGLVGIIVPGMCSNPEPNSGIRQLNDSPMDISWMHLAELQQRSTGKIAILESKLERLRSSRYPAARMLTARIEIHARLQLNQLEHLPAAVACLDRGRIDAQAHDASGRKVWEPESSTTTHTGVPPEGIRSPVLLLGLLVACCADRDLRVVIVQWRGYSDETAWRAWLDELSALVEAPYSVLVAAMREPRFDLRIAAAIQLVRSAEAQPEGLFYAHLLLLWQLLSSAWAPDVIERFAHVVSRQWMVVTQSPALLKMPRLTVPEIAEACAATVPAKQKVARILLAASAAVSVMLSASDMQSLRADAGVQ